MKRVLVASILGLAASVVSSYGQANYFFDTYSASAAAPQGVVTWTTDASLAPAGEAGLAVADAEGFVADLLWQSGTTTGDLGMAIPTSTQGGTPGWVVAPNFVSFFNSYGGGAITMTIQAWQGASFANATAKGSLTWVEAGVIPGDSPSFFGSLPEGPIEVALTIPEPGTFALAGLGAAALLIFRKRQ